MCVQAIDNYHTALAYKPDLSFADDMLKKALEDEFLMSDPLQDFPVSPGTEAAASPEVSEAIDDNDDDDIMDDI